MSGNRAVVYLKPGVVEVKDIDDPKFEDRRGCKITHGGILKVISTNICGSDQHVVRGCTSAPAGLVLGHEITGEVIETRVPWDTTCVGPTRKQGPRPVRCHASNAAEGGEVGFIR